MHIIVYFATSFSEKAFKFDKFEKLAISALKLLPTKETEGNAFARNFKRYILCNDHFSKETTCFSLYERKTP